jgi:hypothetical protein
MLDPLITKRHTALIGDDSEAGLRVLGQMVYALLALWHNHHAVVVVHTLWLVEAFNERVVHVKHIKQAGLLSIDL